MGYLDMEWMSLLMLFMLTFPLLSFGHCWRFYSFGLGSSLSYPLEIALEFVLLYILFTRA
jgi:hypothetical protein